MAKGRKTKEVKLLEQQVELLKLIASKLGASKIEIKSATQPPKGSGGGSGGDDDK